MCPLASRVCKPFLCGLQHFIFLLLGKQKAVVEPRCCRFLVFSFLHFCLFCSPEGSLLFSLTNKTCESLKFELTISVMVL